MGLTDDCLGYQYQQGILRGSLESGQPPKIRILQ